MVLPHGMFRRACEFMAERFGVATTGRGRFNLLASRRWGAAGVYFDPTGQASYCVVDVPGSVLAVLPSSEAALSLAQALRACGGRASRLDVALDWGGGRGASIIDSAVASCEAGELCGARCWRVVESRKQTERTGRTLYLGLRGDSGSGRFVRIYDKGQETASRPEGQWVRYEAELTADVADQVLCKLIDAGPDWADVAAGCALGCVDFRADNGRTLLAERPRCAWWSAVLAVPVERVRSPRYATSYAGWATWMRRAVLPGFAAMCALAGGLTLDQFAARYLDVPDLASVAASTSQAGLEFERFVWDGGQPPEGEASYV